MQCSRLVAESLLAVGTEMSFMARIDDLAISSRSPECCSKSRKRPDPLSTSKIGRVPGI